MFSNAPSNIKYLGEASTWYLYANIAVNNILEYNPNSKFIVMLRNHLKMVPSLHKQLLLNKKRNRNQFLKAWDLQEERRKREKTPEYCQDKNMLLYGPFYKIGEQLNQLFGKYDKENIQAVFRRPKK